MGYMHSGIGLEFYYLISVQEERWKTPHSQNFYYIIIIVLFFNVLIYFIFTQRFFLLLFREEGSDKNVDAREKHRLVASHIWPVQRLHTPRQKSVHAWSGNRPCNLLYEKWLEEAWVGQQVGWGMVWWNHQGRAKGVR